MLWWRAPAEPTWPRRGGPRGFAVQLVEHPFRAETVWPRFAPAEQALFGALRHRMSVCFVDGDISTVSDAVAACRHLPDLS